MEPAARRQDLVLIGRWFLALLLGATLATWPAAAHKKHRQEAQAASASSVPAAEEKRPELKVVRTAPGAPGEGERVGREVPRSTAGRLVDWVGRMHPMVVHFPLAFLPAALLAALLGRRRPALMAAARFLIVLGGISAPLATALGWIDSGFVLFDGDRLILAHRWLGTTIGIAGLVLALWAWREPARVRGKGMISSLAAITAALAVQGWLGGAMVHGIDHMLL